MADSIAHFVVSPLDYIEGIDIPTDLANIISKFPFYFKKKNHLRTSIL